MTWLRRPIPALALAWLLFLAALLSPEIAGLGPLGAWAQRPWFEQAVVKSVLVSLALVAMALGGGSWADWGFRRPREARWRRSALRGGALGAATSVAIILSPARGMPWLGALGFLGLVAWVWIWSSVTEEIFVRGWFQGFVDPGPAARHSGDPTRALSALLFGSMHLSLFRYGADAWTVTVVVAATTVLGWLTAQDRARSGSLAQPIATHIAFNVGGMVGAILMTLATIAVTGQPPVLPS